MHTRQGVVADPQHESSVISNQPTPKINPAVAALFREGFPLDDVRSLPFVKETRNGRVFWSCPRSVDYTQDCEAGTRYAAAYLIYTSRNGSLALPLTWIVRDMPRSHTGFAVGFLSHLEVYFRGHASLMSGAEIERYASRHIAQDRAVLEAAAVPPGFPELE